MMEQSFPQDYPSTYSPATATMEEQAPALPNNIAAVALFTVLGVVAAVVTFIAARARRKPKTARERLMELVEEGRVFGTQMAERIGTGVRDGIERIRNR